jgi:hypothetical protein
MALTYQTLTNQIQLYTNRNDDDFNSLLPSFITQAINRIYYEAKDIGFETTIIGEVLPGNPIQELELTTNWKETLSLILRDPRLNPVSQILTPRSYEFCVNYWPDVNITDVPLFYNMRTYGQLYLSPVPEFNYTYEFNYLGIPLLTEQSPTNFLTERYPSLLFYACMIETIPFLKTDERLLTYENLYSKALYNINSTSKDRHVDRTVTLGKD